MNGKSQGSHSRQRVVRTVAMDLAVVLGLVVSVADCSKSKRTANDSARTCSLSLVGPRELRAAHTGRQLHLPNYWTTDAVWLEGDAMLVGREFDFAFALAGDIGPAIAANKRQKDARETAQQVKSVGPLDLAPTVLRSLGAVPGWCSRMSGRPVWLYALLFGDKEARLQVVLDLRASSDAGPPPVTQLVAVSEAHALQGPRSWLGDDGKLLRQGVQSLATAIATLASVDPTALPAGDERVECAVAGRESWQGAKVSSVEHALFVSGADPTLVFCADPLAPGRPAPTPPPMASERVQP